MKIALSSDESNELTTVLIDELTKRGHAVIRFGAINPDDRDPDWVLASAHAAEAVSRGEADEGIVCCWTGTGASIAANKIKGIRCALVHDAQTAEGARIWNHANVLALSLRATPIPVMREILDAWFSTPTNEGEAVSEWNLEQLRRLRGLEE
jgi:ribose 5-phosphate isomerase B